MTDRQLIILQTIVEQVKAKSSLNPATRCYEQTAPLDIPMETTDFIELDNIQNYLNDILEDIPRMAN